MTVRRDGKLVRSCYRVDGSSAQLKLETTIKTIIGDADDAMAKSSAPYASSSAAPK